MAAFVAEAISSYAIRLHYYSDAWLFAVIGMLLFLGLSGRRFVRATPLWLVAVSAVGTVVFGPVLDVALGARFGAASSERCHPRLAAVWASPCC